MVRLVYAHSCAHLQNKPAETSATQETNFDLATMKRQKTIINLPSGKTPRPAGMGAKCPKETWWHGRSDHATASPCSSAQRTKTVQKKGPAIAKLLVMSKLIILRMLHFSDFTSLDQDLHIILDGQHGLHLLDRFEATHIHPHQVTAPPAWPP